MGFLRARGLSLEFVRGDKKLQGFGGIFLVRDETQSQ